MSAIINDTVHAVGKVTVQRWDALGTLVEDRQVDNLLVATGLAYIASRIKDATSAVMSHMALGSGTTAATGAQTGLITELGRVGLTATTVAANATTYTATFNPGTGTGAVTEAGIFNAASVGTMLNRVVFPVVNKQAGDTISVTWTVTINAV